MLDEDEFWNNTLSLTFEKEPELATAMAMHFAVLRDKLATGENGITEAIRILNDGITELYPYTDFNHACIRLYHRYISNEGLLPCNDPLTIVPDFEEAERKARTKQKKTVKAAKKRKPTLKLVKGKRVA